MIPNQFSVSITGEGNSGPVPVRLEIGPGLLFLGVALIVVLGLTLGRK